MPPLQPTQRPPVYLQVGDDGVLHVLLLLLQEVETHGVESVRAQFIVPEENLEGRGGDFYLLKTSFFSHRNCCFQI